MDSIADLLAGYKREEPAEIRIIKDYIRERFDEAAGVLVREHDIVVTVRSSALAGALRMHVYRLENLLAANAEFDEAAVPKRLLIRVGTIDTA